MPRLVVGPFEAARTETLRSIRTFLEARGRTPTDLDGQEGSMAVALDPPVHRRQRGPSAWLRLDRDGYLRIEPFGPHVFDRGDRLLVPRSTYDQTRDLALSLGELHRQSVAAGGSDGPDAPPPPGVLNPRVERSTNPEYLSVGLMSLVAGGLFYGFLGYAQSARGDDETPPIVLVVLGSAATGVGAVFSILAIALPNEALLPEGELRLVPSAPGADVGGSFVSRF